MLTSVREFGRRAVKPYAISRARGRRRNDATRTHSRVLGLKLGSRPTLSGRQQKPDNVVKAKSAVQLILVAHVETRPHTHTHENDCRYCCCCCCCRPELTLTRDETSQDIAVQASKQASKLAKGVRRFLWLMRTRVDVFVVVRQRSTRP